MLEALLPTSLLSVPVPPPPELTLGGEGGGEKKPTWGYPSHLVTSEPIWVAPFFVFLVLFLDLVSHFLFFFILFYFSSFVILFLIFLFFVFVGERGAWEHPSSLWTSAQRTLP